MALFTFDKTYSVGIQFVDDQHAGLFDSLNELHSAMLKGQAKCSDWPPVAGSAGLHTESFFRRGGNAGKGKIPWLGRASGKTSRC